MLLLGVKGSGRAAAALARGSGLRRLSTSARKSPHSNTPPPRRAQMRRERPPPPPPTPNRVPTRFAPPLVWTHPDEAPALASYALLPVIKRFTQPAGIDVASADISVAARILSAFPERLTVEQAAESGKDELAALGELAKTPEANIIKLPNVSASIPQLTAAIAELQSKGYDVPAYPAEPSSDAEREIQAKYAKVLGSAVNPVLREGNSDRRVAGPVKAYAQRVPHKMGAWEPTSKTHVAHMADGDFYGSEQSHTMAREGSVRIELEGADGSVSVLKDSVALQSAEVIDSSLMSASKLRAFFEAEFASAKADNLMVSLHLKATMMKISDPILFGHALSVFFAPLFEKHADALAAAGVNPNLGLGSLISAIADSPEREAMEATISECYASRPSLAMVDSDRGITNLHVPSDVIIDASMPVVVRDSGRMWNKAGELEDVKCIIPDRSYARMYQAIIEDCRNEGQFDVSTMGNVPNVGLMAQKVWR